MPNIMGKIMVGVGAVALFGAVGYGGYYAWKKYYPAKPVNPGVPTPATPAAAPQPSQNPPEQGNGTLGRVRTPVSNW